MVANRVANFFEPIVPNYQKIVPKRYLIMPDFKPPKASIRNF
jgi:hypothetical protein